jgi:hypothetical protein
MTHFPVLRKEETTDAKKYVEKMWFLQQGFISCLNIYTSYEATVNLFSISFYINVRSAYVCEQFFSEMKVVESKSRSPTL